MAIILVHKADPQHINAAEGDILSVFESGTQFTDGDLVCFEKVEIPGVDAKALYEKLESLKPKQRAAWLVKGEPGKYIFERPLEVCLWQDPVSLKWKEKAEDEYFAVNIKDFQKDDFAALKDGTAGEKLAVFDKAKIPGMADPKNQTERPISQVTAGQPK
jgi:hypothetical protein